MEREIPIRASQAPECRSENAPKTQLIARAQQGDEEAFTALYELYKRRVYSLCLRMTRSAADAEDLTQEALLLFFRKLPSFRGESALTTWLHRIVMNVVLMHLRKKRPHQVSLDEAETGQDLPRRQYGAPDQRLKACPLRVSLERAISNLPSGYRSIYLLHEIHGYEHAEIAQIVNCTPGNSKSQLHKARLKLRHLLRSAGAKANAALKTPKRRKESADRSSVLVPAVTSEYCL